MNFLIFALLVVPTVYSLHPILPVLPLSWINDKAIEKSFGISKFGVPVLKSVTIDVKKANKLSPLPQYPNIVEDFFSSSTDIDRNWQPDNQQDSFVLPIIGPIYIRGFHTYGKPLIPQEALKKEWDQKDGSLKSIKIDVEKVRKYLKGSYSPLLPFPYPVTLGAEEIDGAVEINE